MKSLTLFLGLTLAAAPLSGQTPTESQAKHPKTHGNLRILSGRASVIDARTLKERSAIPLRPGLKSHVPRIAKGR